MSETYEKLGAFYLGKQYDLSQNELRDELLLYDSKDLLTHGVCFGMTGSGKTGLSVCLLEEALIDGIPVIAIDPKGDLANLLLNFPNLRPKDFEPWVQESTARQKGLTKKEFASNQAALWKKGIGQWGQDGERIQKLRDSAEFSIYTPGSEAGLPVSMLKSFNAPSEELRNDREQMRDRVQAASSSILGLMGIDADPVQSREHILLSLILDKAWRAGRNLSLPQVIQQIQKPPVERVGVFELEDFYPAGDRMGLAMALNNLLASPGFEVWMQGEALDLDKMLYTPEGKPRISIFSIAHLGDAERMFFVSSLLGETLSWMRRQSGTTSLRAMLYMDEIYGYLPPTANPPSKKPLMTLMKQARAFGLGVLLSTQNPKDLDYKALSNAGTWFIGRLQTDRDRDRVLDGLEGAAAGSGAEFDRQEMENQISGLDKRVFLLYNVHDDRPTAFHTRWALSYLSGPLTREQIEVLMADHKGAAVVVEAPAADTVPDEPARPSLGDGVPEYFLPVDSLGPADAKLAYEPVLMGASRLRFSDVRKKVDEPREIVAWTPFDDGPTPVDWEHAEEIEIDPGDLEPEPRGSSAEYSAPPKQAQRVRSYKTWEKRFATWIYANQRLTLYKCAQLKQVSRPSEDERAFRIRLEHLAREKRDALADKLRKRYVPKIARLDDRVRKAQQRVQKEKEQAKTSVLQSTFSIGATVLGALFGNKLASATNVRRAGTAARAISRAGRERSDVGRAAENLEALEQQLADLQVEFDEEVATTEDAIDVLNEEFETVQIRPKKTDIQVRICALVWMPYWKGPSGSREQAWG